MVSVAKLVVVCFLGGLSVFLGSLVCTFQVLLVQRKNLVRLAQQQTKGGSSSGKQGKNFLETIKPTHETRALQLWKKRVPSTSEIPAAALGYWNQVLPYLQQWNGILVEEDAPSASTLPPPTKDTWFALQQAARLGHSEAQYFVANALASGILPFSLAGNLTVPMDISPQHNDVSTIESQLNWHMSAVDGHIASAVSLGYRKQDSCQAALPYYQEASHGIIDYLEQYKHSRTKVTLPMDTHVLSEIFATGSASQQSWANQPDEPADAIRYYHMRATSGDDVQAAYTLAHLHHYGLRGVPQNLTTALYYYDMASQMGNMEAAGQAGKFHLWGIGMEWKDRNLVKAHSYFQQGVPYGLEGCRKRFRNLQVQKNRRTEDDLVCDHPSLNGLGLLYLFGMPLLLSVDEQKATKLFELARDMGNMDASYNLAMMRLGWKTHYHTLEDALLQEKSDGNKEDKQPQSLALPSFLAHSTSQRSTPSKADYLVALQELVTAANKGHLQARHRLAMMYAHGIRDIDGTVIISRDCTKALKHFKWITQNANPYLSEYTRKAYKYYVANNLDAALYNYLAAAELGHEVSQINAAFLLDQGVCLSLKEKDCAAASLRLWKAAVDTSSQAALSVGDVYYYGRLRDSPKVPFEWFSYFLYPEQYVVPVFKNIYQQMVQWSNNNAKEEANEEETCVAQGEDGACPVVEEEKENDLEMAARYYRLAAEMHKSPRGNFNLGFLYEWGLGVKQDFPLAKRHYDLAKTAPTAEADLAVQVALAAMNIHERIVKWQVAWSAKRQKSEASSRIPRASENEVGHPVPSSPPEEHAPRTKTDVIIKHLLSWESLLIVILTIVLSKLLRHRRTP